MNGAIGPVVMAVVVGLAVASFAGFAVLARYNRPRIALVLAGLAFVWLVFLIVRYLTETYDISRVALGVFAACQVLYMASGALGWWVGRARRRTR